MQWAIPIERVAHVDVRDVPHERRLPRQEEGEVEREQGLQVSLAPGGDVLVVEAGEGVATRVLESFHQIEAAHRAGGEAVLVHEAAERRVDLNGPSDLLRLRLTHLLRLLGEFGDVLAWWTGLVDSPDEVLDRDLDQLDGQAPLEKRSIDIARHQPVGRFSDQADPAEAEHLPRVGEDELLSQSRRHLLRRSEKDPSFSTVLAYARKDLE